MNKEVKPTYVTFEQAKRLKEKGLYFPLSSDNYYWTSDGERIASYNWFTPEELSNYVDSLQQWQVVEWLRVNHGIWIGLVADCDYKFKFEINTWSWYELEKSHRLGHRVLGETMWDTSSKPFDSPQEAYSAAFSYVLNNLI
jgi:hypothetical protein